jgi:hypothetical protein
METFDRDAAQNQRAGACQNRKSRATFSGHGLALAGRLPEHRAASGTEFGFLVLQAIGYARLVGNLIGAQTVSVILTCLFLLRPQIGLAESGSGQGQRDHNEKKSRFKLHSVKPLF